MKTRLFVITLLYLLVVPLAFAQGTPSPTCDPVWGCVNNPLPPGASPQGLFTNILRLVFFGAGLWSFINIILAGFQFMNAGGDAKAIQAAWGRIWQSLLGLLIIVSSFVVSAIVGFLIFHDPLFMLRPPKI